MQTRPQIQLVILPVVALTNALSNYQSVMTKRTSLVGGKVVSDSQELSLSDLPTGSPFMAELLARYRIVVLNIYIRLTVLREPTQDM
jgi:hypothetical protein